MARYEKNRFGSIVLTDVNTHEKFTVTKKEQQEIKKLVKRANAKTTYKNNKYFDMVKEQNNMKGISKEAHRNLLERKGFLTEKYSTSMKQFTSKEDVKDFIKELKTVTKKGYGDRRIKDIRKSMSDRVLRNFGEDGKEIVKRLKSLSDSQLLSIYIHNDDLIQDIYGSPEVVGESFDGLVSKTLSDINVAISKTKKR